MKLGVLKDKSLAAVKGNNFLRISDKGITSSMLDVIKAGDSQLKKISELMENYNDYEEVDISLFDAPLKNPSKIIAIGLNYSDHAKEARLEIPKTPLVFAKFPNSITGPADTIYIPRDLTQKVDYEVELGIVIGKKAKNVKKKDALNYVYGYMVLNDISARDLQFSDGQWVRAKSLDTFCPMGPFIITADEIKDPQNLKLVCEVNGQNMQDSSTSNMIFGAADLVSILSHAFTLEPGDIIATGTPGGVGFSRRPPIYLKDGDIIKTRIEGIGELVNPVKEI
ncbi:MAG: fumarylacetoacetate hydrolase family protein [Ignavibacteriaceae bacterium]